MSGKNGISERRTAGRREGHDDSVFLPPIAGVAGGDKRVVVREDVHERALETARKILRAYVSERRRQL
jgi:hypothetical protein